MSYPTLFSKFQLKSLSLANRIVMAPMTRVFSPNGLPTPAVSAYYERRAESDVGLIITEGTVIERPASKNEAGITNFYGAALDEWKKVATAVHGKGGLIAPQLWHTGAAKGRDETYRPQPLDTPSGMSLGGKAMCAPMTDDDVEACIAAFVEAAKAAKASGFDALEFHGAHGYLIDEFFWSQTNNRNDRWGGATIGERARFAADIISRSRAAIGPDFPIIIRISQWKTGSYDAKNAYSPEELTDWLRPLVDAGADMFHCSQRRFWEAEFAGSDLNFAGWVKKLTGKPTISVGSVGLSGEFIAGFAGEVSQAQTQYLDQLERRLEAGEFDLIAVGRALLSDPAWVSKVRDGKFSELKGFSARDLATLY